LKLAGKPRGVITIPMSDPVRGRVTSLVQFNAVQLCNESDQLASGGDNWPGSRLVAVPRTRRRAPLASSSRRPLVRCVHAAPALKTRRHNARARPGYKETHEAEARASKAAKAPNPSYPESRYQSPKIFTASFSPGAAKCQALMEAGD
jgi:hypothetical protein